MSSICIASVSKLDPFRVFYNMSTCCQKTKYSISNSYTLICKEDHSNCSCLCTMFGICSKPLSFDISGIISHSGLTMMIGGDSSGIKVREKFFNLHNDLKKRYTRTHLWLLFILILSLVASTIVFMLGNFHELRCQSSLLCTVPNTTQGEEFNCPVESSWTIGCCYVYCHESRNLIDGLVPGCHPVTKFNQDIQQKKAFNPECNCIQTAKENHGRKRCGEIQLYGVFEKVPSHFASANIRTCIKLITGSILVSMIIANCLYNCYWIARIKKIVQYHFHDWQVHGIKVEYNPRKKHQSGHLALNLPSPVSGNSPSPYPSNQIGNNGDTSYGFSYNRY